MPIELQTWAIKSSNLLSWLLSKGVVHCVVHCVFLSRFKALCGNPVLHFFTWKQAKLFHRKGRIVQLFCPLFWVRQMSSLRAASVREHWEGIWGLVVLKSVNSARHRFAVSELWMGAEHQAGSANPDPFCTSWGWQGEVMGHTAPAPELLSQLQIKRHFGKAEVAVNNKKKPAHNGSHQIVNKLGNHV